MTIRRGTQIWRAGLLLVPLAGCGDPLTSASAYDVPLFTLRGDLNPAPEDLVAPRVDLVWVDPVGQSDDIPEPLLETQLQLDGAGYVFSIFAPPPATAVREIVDATTGAVAARFAFGEIVLYEDGDGDGTLRVTSLADGSAIVAPDVYWGASAQNVVIYIKTPWSATTKAPELLGLLSHEPGYHLGVIDCSAPDVPVTFITGNADARADISVLPNGTSQLPYVRDCLRSHPVAPASGSSMP